MNAHLSTFLRSSRRARLLLAASTASLAFAVQAPHAAHAAGCGGTQLVPGDDVAAKVNAAPAGATFCFAPGTYRVTTTIKPKAGVSLLGSPGAVISGAKVLSGFTRAGSQWVVGGQTQAPSLNRGAPGSGLMYPQARYDDNVFADGKQLWKAGVKVGGQVLGKAATSIGAGEYFFDYDADKIYLGSDPTGHTLEVAVAPTLIESSAANVTVSGLTVQMSADRGVSALAAWKITGNELRLNATNGVTALDGTTIANNSIHNNGVYGISGKGANVVVDSNEVAYNDSSRLETSDGSCNNNGGSKFVNTVNLVVRNNNFHDNYCNGIWLDIDNYNSLIEGNKSDNNLGHGILHEISYKATIRNNEASGNEGWGILVRCSPDDTITGNTVAGNTAGALMLLQRVRTDHPSSYGAHVIANTDISGNTFRMSGTAVKFGAVDTNGSTALFKSGNRFHGNTYYVSSLKDRVFRWGGPGLDSQGWKGAGQDVDGTFVAAP